MTRTINFTGHGANVVGSLGSGSLVQDMPPALSFDGDDYVLPTFTASRGVASTWTCWFKTDGWDTGRNGLMLTSSEDMMVGVSDKDDDGKLYVGDFWGATTYRIRSQPLISGTWNFVARTTDGAGGIKLYVNSYPVTSTTGQSTAGSAAVFSIGDRATQDKGFTGQIRDVRVFSSELDSDEVAEVQDDIVMAGTSVTPVHWYQMEEGTGVTAQDSGSSEDDGAINGATWVKDKYNLNQIGAGSVSGATTVSGGTWNLRDSTYMDFDGSGDYVSIPSDASLDEPKTIAFWCKPTASQDAQIISRGSNDYEVYIHTSTDTFWGYWGTQSTVGADGPSVSFGEWQHIVTTLDDSTSPPTARWYKNGVLIDAQAISGTPAYSDDSALEFGRRTGGTQEYTGSLKGVRLYDTQLTDAQVDLLYKGQWDGSPVGWWKLNEGTGVIATDSGTGADNGTITNATWVKPDFTGDGPQLKAGTTMSAPQGRYYLKYFAGTAPERDWNQHADATFIHNSGTVTIASGDSGIYNSTTAGPFYDVINDESCTFNMRASSKTTIENNFFSTAGYWVMGNNASLEMGTTSSAGTISGNSVGRYTYMIGGGNTTMLISGASQANPSIWKGTIPTDIYWRGYWANSAGTATFKFKNLDIQDTVTLGSGTNTAGHERATNFLLEGDTEFDAVTIGAGCEFDLNGQRAEFGDYVTYTGTWDADGLAVFHGGFTKYGTLNNAASGDIIALNDTGLATFSYIGGYRTFFQNGGVQLGTGGFTNVGKAIVAGTTNVGTRDTSSEYLSIPIGGELQAEAKTHTVSGNFNMAGGFIGQGAFSGDGANNNYVDIWNSDISDFEFGTGPLTIEAWVKGTSAGGLLGSYWGSDLPMYQIDVGDGTATSMRILATGAGGASTDGLTTVNANATTNVIDGKWHHVVGVRDTTAGLVKLYIDGKLENESSDAATVAEGGNVDNGQRKRVGARGAYGELNGNIARASFWKSALSESDIRSMMFQDWVAASGSSVDQTKCVAWYEFSDNQEATNVTDMTGSGNTGVLTSTDLWAGPGTFTYETSTLKFDKAGTCNLYGHQDGTSTNLYSLTVTNGTTLESYCQSNDFVVNSGATLVNSGTLNSNRNWQYKSPNMPIVGASSDLTVGNNIFYYFAPAVSGAGTTYRSFQPGNGVDLYMQGDFSAYSIYPYSDSIVHFNGYKGTAGYAGLNSYSSGNVVLEPGSSINFPNASLRGFYANNGGTESYITANGEACAIFPGEYGGPQDEIDLPAGVLESLPQSTCSISMWVNIKDDDNNPYEGFFGSAVGKQFTMWRQDTGRLMFSIGGPAEQFSIFPSITSGVWYHIGMTYDGATVKGYFDGTQTGSRSYAGSWTTGESTIGAYQVGGSNSFDGKIADVRIFPTTLSDANFATLASENPATSVSGAYADPTNSLGAISWYKLGATPSGTLDASNFGTSGATFDGSIDGIVKSGFVTISGNAGFKAINNPYEQITLTNTYISGMADIVVGETSQGANTSSILKTKGTVVLD